jgi:glycosyltransferase involved in cell wall biosynthesis
MPAPCIPIPCIIVPAHNEAGTIAEALAALAPIGQDAAAGQLIVVCNGCSDDTAAIARAAAPAAVVLTLAERGKIGAINQGLALAAPGSVIVMDADVVLSPHCLDALGAALAQADVLAASPMPNFDLSRAPWPVRAYYRAFASHPYLQHGVGGSGVFGLSAQGRAALGTLPPMIADDHYVRSRFALSAQRRVTCTRDGTPVWAKVRPPYSLRALIHTERRSQFGVRDVHERLLGDGPTAGRSTTLRWMIATALRHPIDCAVFLAIKLWSQATAGRYRPGGMHGWTTLRGG